MWLVIETGLDLLCAVKHIPPEKVINQGNFFHEAQMLKKAEHPNIIKVYDTGVLSDGRIYVSMEYLPKGSLEDETKGGFVKLSRAKEVMIDVLRGLEHAHLKEIVHRDIKPANILIGKHGEGVLSDFGLALPDIKTINLASLKTYQYLLHLAPEVNDFHEQTVLSDIYACGITLYRLVNGDIYLPKVSPSDARLLAKRGKFPDRNKYREFVPRQLKLVINKATNLEPAKRFQSACEMRRALEQISIQTDWEETKLSTGYRWRGKKGDLHFEIMRSISPQNGMITVATRKGKIITKLSKVNSLSKEFFSNDQAITFCKQVLQQITVGSK